MEEDPRICASEPPWADPPAELTNGDLALVAEMRAARVAEWTSHSFADRKILLLVWDERHRL